MPAHLVQIVVAAADPARLARFWSVALGWPIAVAEAGEVVVEPPGDGSAQRGQLPLVFVPGPEVKTTKNRVHLDLASVSVEHQAVLVARLEDLGARRLDIGQGAVSWVVMADPEGNEFCVVSHLGSVGKDPASAFAGIGPVAAVVFDCADPEGIAPFWAAVTGWAALGRDDQGVWLRDVTAGGPYLDLHRVSEPKQVTLRVQLALAADDHAAEVERVRAIGAREADAGRADVHGLVLTDPEGNELSVLAPR
jgi:predicted enzyme related to lactoylglutathione lyase